MSISTLLDISKQALFVNQGAMRVVSHNISNVNTVGFSRQEAVLSPLMSKGGNEISGGHGVQITTVKSKIDALVEKRLLLSSGELGRLEARSRFLPHIENVFNEMSGDGVGMRLEQYFAATDDLAENPSNPVSRSQVLIQGEAMSDYINSMYQNLSEVALPVDEEISYQIEDMNTRLKALSELNLAIIHQETSPNPALDLKDQRRTMVDEMAKMIDLQTFDTPDGGITMLTSQGQLLMDHDYYASFARGGTNLTPTGFQQIKINERQADITNQIKSGELKGLLEVRDDLVHGNGGWMERLEQFVDELRWQTNEIHSQNVGNSLFTGQTGGFELTMYNTASSHIVPQGTTFSAGSMTFGVGADSSNLTNFSVAIAASSTLEDVATAINAAAGNAGKITAAVNANRLQLTKGGADDFVVVANDLEVLNRNLMEEAFATPDGYRMQDGGTITLAYGATQESLSTSTIVIPAGSTAKDVADLLQASPAVNASIASGKLVLTAQAGYYGVVSDTSGSLAALGVGAFFVGSGARNLAVAQELLDSPDRVGAGRLATESGQIVFNDLDNRGALAISQQRADRISLFGDTATLVEHYAGVVGDLGSTMKSNEDTLKAKQTAYDFVKETRESISGVSMEEELASIIKFQRSFQAAAKMVTVADDLLSTIIQMVR
ncbi:MAG: flagellar hook-associated protein FlgK [Magnetococcales bacterium]|nr:flagellar hook-associated protein FlgK [Magnetococcales bacterium]